MNLTFEDQPEARVITVGESRIDAAIAIVFKDAMREITDSGPERMIVDMGNVDFIDSSGLGAIVASLKQIPAGKAMELAALSPTVKKVFHLTRMDTVFVIHPDVAAAVAPVAKIG